MLQIEDIHKQFARQEVLKGVNLSLDKGESVVVIGQSGCGKSVLLKHVIKLLEPDRGRVIFDGKDIARLGSKELVSVRLRIGMLFQSAALFDSLTVAENVGLGLRESRQYRANEIGRLVSEKLKLVELQDAAAMNPAELSGGMRKRVGLARAIATDPEMLLYDEPTTGLDPITAELINDLIVELNRRLSVTSITVTHDMHSALKIASRIVMLHGGRVIFDGTPDQMLSCDDPPVRAFLRTSGPAHGRP